MSATCKRIAWRSRQGRGAAHRPLADNGAYLARITPHHKARGRFAIRDNSQRQKLEAVVARLPGDYCPLIGTPPALKWDWLGVGCYFPGRNTFREGPLFFSMSLFVGRVCAVWLGVCGFARKLYYVRHKFASSAICANDIDIIDIHWIWWPFAPDAEYLCCLPSPPLHSS